MKSKATPKFWKLYNQLPTDMQRGARKAYQTWKTNPRTPSLQFKRVSKAVPVYSARINDNYRVVGVLQDDTVTWFWIGDHDKYERLLKQLS